MPSLPATASVGVSVLGVAGIALFVAAVTVSAALATYRHFLDRTTRFATVDVQAVLETKQLQLASMVSGKAVTDRERGAAYDMASRFGQEFQAALNTVQAECDCVLLTAGAVVHGNAPDLTERVKELVGLGSANKAVLQQQLENNLSFSPKPAEK